ncbi:hypothetical protein STSP2_00346 [Anaerohalosphaera lusitana]|uniref:Uncharacterized protein n=1 Tax=Anaerohalosphaera lusitana TaxID=1936003 RepID=A0A1U9NGZ5_9BACT|nr:hypothetical protein [Anaerohalosphaera lusitana]AQT67203.1 hypothetical protein STSP2_00346 [Anaerohalosphaera lusitana]
MIKLEWKSLLVGVVIGAGCLIFMGAKLGPVERRIATRPVGRFELYFTEDNALMVDTMTGQVWNRITLTKTGHRIVNQDFYKNKLELKSDKD